MSISTKNTTPEDEEFADIEFRPRPLKQDTPEEQPDNKPEETESPEEKTEVTPAETAAEQPSTTTGEKEAPEAPRKKGGAAAVIFDTLLVIILLAVLGGGGYYIKQQMDLYRVPTPMELALQENTRLQKQHDELTNAFYKADEQIAMRKSLAHLNSELARLQAECSKLEASIDSQKNNILAMQHEIRTADKEHRAIATSLLPGMAIGDAVTNRGKALSNAYINRLEGKLIVLRSHEGQIRVPIRELIKKDMPKMARYAFGEEDLIDMSDFDANGEAPANTESADEEDTPGSTMRKEPDYEVRSGAPTGDTSNGTTITAPVTLPDAGATWDAPSGELPF